MDMRVVGAVSRAGESHSVLFCEYTGAERENTLISDFLDGLKVTLNRQSIYCLAAYSENDTVKKIVGIYYHKNGVECMMYERAFEYLNDYVADIFSDELQEILKTSEGS